LSQKNIQVHYDITLTHFREQDKSIILALYKAGYIGEDLLSINKHRIFLNTYFLSDIFTSNGTAIKAHAAQGIKGPRINTAQWSNQGNPSSNDWSKEEECVKVLACQFKLGSWLEVNNNIWIHSPDDDALFKKVGTSWLRYRPLHHAARQRYFTLLWHIATNVHNIWNPCEQDQPVHGSAWL
jgi:hypothetical protein